MWTDDSLLSASVDRIPLVDVYDDNIPNKKELSRSYMSLECYMYLHKLKDCVYYRDIDPLDLGLKIHHYMI